MALVRCFSGSAPTSTSGASPQASQSRVPYRHRASDPRTRREIGDFRRDMQYSQRRPLPSLPWIQGKHRTYLDDAERLYGRKETWCDIEDEVLREKLSLILQDFLRDTLDAAELEARHARKYHRKCCKMAEEYRSFIAAGGWSSVEALRSWASLSEVGRRREGEADGDDDSGRCAAALEDPMGGSRPASGGEEEAFARSAAGQAGAEVGNTGVSEERVDDDGEERIFLDYRRRRGEQADAEDTVATWDLIGREAVANRVSAFPFLRQRAIDDEGSLDPSLVDWTAKYFPDDTSSTFAYPRPPAHREATNKVVEDSTSVDGTSTSPVVRGGPLDDPVPDISLEKADGASGARIATWRRARNRLRDSLRGHEDHRRATFDAEGVFYYVRRPGDIDGRTPAPKAVRGSDARLDGSQKEVVKVGWDIVARAGEQTKTPDVLRAKERLLRLTRGENPDTIP